MRMAMIVVAGIAGVYLMRDGPPVTGGLRARSQERRPRLPPLALPRGAREVAATSVATTMAVIPVFLLGGMSVLLRQDLQFDEAALGLSAASFFAATSLVSVLGGRIAERIGARAGMLFAVAVIGVEELLGERGGRHAEVGLWFAYVSVVLSVVNLVIWVVAGTAAVPGTTSLAASLAWMIGAVLVGFPAMRAEILPRPC
jgi:MFS family permease